MGSVVKSFFIAPPRLEKFNSLIFMTAKTCFIYGKFSQGRAYAAGGRD